MKRFVPLGLFLILVGFLYFGLALDPKKLPSPFIGKPFPDLQVEDFKTGEIYSIRDQLINQITLVNVWASWCVTCRAEHQTLMEIAQTGRVKMLGINYKDTKKDGALLLAKSGNPYQTIVFDQSGALGLELGVYATPETFIVDKQGIIRYKRIGALTMLRWHADIIPLIKQLK